MQYFIQFCSLLIFLFFTNCSGQDTGDQSTVEKIENQSNGEFNAYWYAGKAEITSYDLQQARYDEIHNGEAVLIFVTEDFLVEKQVKDEGLSQNASVSVLKLNFVRKFPTGIYDYSMMTSSFIPVHQKKYSPAMKVSSSAQEWCGHAWLQLNKKGEEYEVQSNSYFEGEGDVHTTIETSILEDGLWAQLRLNPDLVPIGEQMVFPSSQYIRMAHKALHAYPAVISKSDYLKEDMPGHQLVELKVDYQNLGRRLEIIYTANFPHEIVGWRELTSTANNSNTFTTVARKKAQLKSPYWNKNSAIDAPLRDSLKLKF
ncbi:MAG: septum formation inhibitor Maf [Verrucomicrobia bacterium]|nr:septum formation inhibitor Maf [Verrucomicrobiota bacterium]